MDVFIYLKKAIFLAALFSSSLLLGCSGIKPYPNDLDKNLVITTTTESGSIFASVKTSLDIYQITTDCSLDYKGTVKLDNATQSVGIPTNIPSYLVFGFTSRSFLASSSGNISYVTVLEARKGYQYLIHASYIDDIYNVEIRETHPRKKTFRRIDRTALNLCK